MTQGVFPVGAACVGASIKRINVLWLCSGWCAGACLGTRRALRALPRPHLALESVGYCIRHWVLQAAGEAQPGNFLSELDGGARLALQSVKGTTGTACLCECFAADAQHHAVALRPVYQQCRQFVLRVWLQHCRAVSGSCMTRCCCICRWHGSNLRRVCVQARCCAQRPFDQILAVAQPWSCTACVRRSTCAWTCLYSGLEVYCTALWLSAFKHLWLLCSPCAQ